jgi:aminopeptidase N
VDPDALHASRNALRRAIAQALRDDLRAKYQALKVTAPYSPDPVQVGRRTLRNVCMGYLVELGETQLADAHYRAADNMTDAMAALVPLAGADCAERLPALEAFYARWKDEPLVVDKWLAVQAGSRLPGTLARVKELLAHPAFDLKVPNKVYALIRGFSANHVRYHAADGAGYDFLADRVIELNALTPQVAARMARGFDRWRKFDAARQAKARAALERIRDAKDLSRDVAEIVGKALA